MTLYFWKYLASKSEIISLVSGMSRLLANWGGNQLGNQAEKIILEAVWLLCNDLTILLKLEVQM